jgi:hypothetical protein
MTFPTSAINGQVTVVNGITYIFSASTTSWTRVPQIVSNIGNLYSQTSMTIFGNIGVNIATPRATLDLGNTTGMMLLPTGGNTQRPTTPLCGAIRFNTCIGAPEWYSGNSATIGVTTYYPGWYPVSSAEGYFSGYNFSYVLVGGGAGSSGGNGSHGGGGGAGSIVMSGATLTSTCKSYLITLGSGGAASTGSNAPGAGGTTAMVATGFSVTATGGGAAPYTSAIGGNNAIYSGNQGAGSGAAGGGAGAGGNAGVPFMYNCLGPFLNGGGVGVCISITGSVLGVGGGGSGSHCNGSNFCPSIGYGGGTRYVNCNGYGGTNTGGGAAGGKCSTNGGSPGGSGVAYISYASPTQRATGGCTVTSYCKAGTKYWVHTFKSSGNFKT